MGSFLSPTTIKRDTSNSTNTAWSAHKEKVLLMGYLRDICTREIIPNDVFQIVLLYYHVKILCIISHNDKIHLIDKKREQNIKYSNQNRRSPVLYQRKLGTINYNLIPYHLNKSLLEQIKPLQNKNTNFRNSQKFIQPHIKNENGANNLQIQDLIDPYNNIHIEKYGQIHWIPTIFEKQKHSKHFKITSEINDLPLCANNRDLYQTIENIFNQFVPSFNDIMYDKLTVEKRQQFNYKNENVICENIYDEERLFVVIKMQDYIFNGSCEYYPNWHKEGYDTEGIDAIGIYYFDIVNGKYFECNELELRCITGLEDKPNGCGKYWRKFDNKSIETSNDMCIVFKNDPLFARFLIDGNENAVLHRAHLKVGEMDNGEKVSRKILSFFVVDPMKGNEKWYKDKVIRSVFDKVNSEKMSKVEYDSNRQSKNSPNNRRGMKPPSWIDDDPLTRVVYAGMGD